MRAEGVVLDATTGKGIPMATVSNYVDGPWETNEFGRWGTFNAFPGLRIDASAYGYQPNFCELTEYQGNVLWCTIKLQLLPPDQTSEGCC